MQLACVDINCCMYNLFSRSNLYMGLRVTRMGLRVPFALVPFGFGNLSPIKFTIKLKKTTCTLDSHV